MGTPKRTPHRIAYLNSWRNSSYWRAKEEAFSILGKRCSSCGFSDARALTFDHIEGGGRAERKKKDSASLMRAIVAEPHRFRVLCWNCNWIAYLERRQAKPIFDQPAIAAMQ